MDLHLYALLRKKLKGFNYVGEYEAGKAYPANSVVKHEGSLYISLVASQEAPEASGEWEVIIPSGEVLKALEDALERSEKAIAKATESADNAEEYAELAKENAELAELASVLANEQAKRAEEASDIVEEFLPNIEGLEHVGAWNNTTEYKRNNEVSFNGSTYRAKVDNVGKQPSADSAEWVLIAQRGVDGEGSVSSVNNISPDENGNVDLGNISADWNSLEGKPEVLDDLGESDGKLTYKGEEVGEKLVIGRKVYVADGNTDTFETEFEIVPNSNRVMVFVSGVIQASGINFTESENSITLSSKPLAGTQVIVYTFSGSETISVGDGGGGVSIDDVRAIVATHGNVIASEDTLGHIRIGEGLLVDGDGVVSVDGNLDIDLSDYVKQGELEHHESILGSGSSQGHVFLMDEPNPNFDVNVGHAVTPKALHDVKEIAEKAFTQASNAREALVSHLIMLAENDGTFYDWYVTALATGKVESVNEDSSMVDIVNILSTFHDTTRKRVETLTVNYNGEGVYIDVSGYFGEVYVKGSLLLNNGNTMAVSARLNAGNRVLTGEDTTLTYTIPAIIKNPKEEYLNDIEFMLDYHMLHDTWTMRGDIQIKAAEIVIPLHFTFVEKESNFV